MRLRSSKLQLKQLQLVITLISFLCCFECAQGLKLAAEAEKKESEVKTVAIDNIISIIKNKTADWH